MENRSKGVLTAPPRHLGWCAVGGGLVCMLSPGRESPQPRCPWRASRCSHFGRGLALAIHALLFRGSPSFRLDCQLRLTVRDSSQAAPSRLLPGEPLTGRSEPSGGSWRHSGTWPSTQALASDPRRHCRRADCPRRRCCPGRSDEDVQSQAPGDLDEILFA